MERAQKRGSGDLERVLSFSCPSKDPEPLIRYFYSGTSVWQVHEKGHPHRAVPIPTNLCEECRSSVLLLHRTFWEDLKSRPIKSRLGARENAREQTTKQPEVGSRKCHVVPT